MASNFVNIEHIIKSSAVGDFNAVVNVLKQYGFSDEKFFQATRYICDSLHMETLYTDFWSMWGFSRLGTYGTCLTATLFYNLIHHFDMHDITKQGSSLLIYCVIGIFALNTDLIGALVTGRTAGVYDIGFVSVNGIGDVFNVTQISRSGTQVGYLSDMHYLSVPRDSLREKGYINTDTFVMYSSDKKFSTVYGIEAVHADGYTTVCIDQNAQPATIVEEILSNEAGAAFGNPVNVMTCSSYVTEGGFVDGLWVHKPETKKGVLNLPLLVKKELAEDSGIRVSSLDGNVTLSVDEEQEDEDTLRYWKNLELEYFRADNTTSELTIDQEHDNTGVSVSSQGWFSTKKEAQIVGTSSIHKVGDGFKTLFISNYVNGYGPPVDYLAGL